MLILRTGHRSGRIDSEVKTEDDLMLEDALNTAAKATYDRMERDASEASSVEVRRKLERLQASLFSPSALEEHEAESREFGRSFQAETGFSIRDYLESGRIETALKLLQRPSLRIGEVAEALGFSSPRAFRQCFARWLNMPPSTYRFRVLSSSSHIGKVSTHDFQSAEVWMRHRCQQIGTADKLKSLRKMKKRSAGRPRVKLSLRGKKWSSELASRLLSAKNKRETRSVEGVVSNASVLIEVLGKCVIIESRKDRFLGVELAQLAVDHLDETANYLEDCSVADLRAVVEARLANALRLAGDWEKAEEALQRSRIARKESREERDLLMRAECLLIEGSFRYQQRRYNESITLLQQAIGLGRAHGSSIVLCNSLLQISTLYIYLDSIETAIPLLRETLRHAKRLGKANIEGAAWQNLAVAEIKLGNLDSAEEAVNNSRSFCSPDDWINRYKLNWIEGRLLCDRGRIEEADDLISETRTVFTERNMIDEAACISLDLAVVRYLAGRQFEALGLAAEAVPVFEALEADMEAHATLSVLQKALVANSITLRELQDARDTFQRLQLDPGRKSTLESV